MLMRLSFVALKARCSDVPKDYVLDAKPPPLTLGKLNICNEINILQLLHVYLFRN